MWYSLKMKNFIIRVRSRADCFIDFLSLSLSSLLFLNLIKGISF